MRARGVTIIILAAFLAAGALASAWWLFLRPRAAPIRIGILHSLTGPLAVSEAPLLDGYRLAVEEINERGGVLGRPLELEIRDGGSDPANFAREAERLLRERDALDIPVIAGCWSSAARKAVVPVLERFDGLLLYPVQFEGLETSPQVTYLGVAPNQQLAPALEWALSNGARSVFLVGSDYIYPHAAHEVARDLLEARGATIVGEAYLPLSGGDPNPIAQRIAELQPDLIVNTVNGDANQGLMRAIRAAGIDPATTKVLALSIGEPEIRAWDPSLFKDVILAGSYFRTVDGDGNRRFLAALRRVAGNDVVAGDALVSAYQGLHLWAQAAHDVGTTHPSSVRRALAGRHMDGPGGTMVIDPSSRYSWKPVRIGRVRGDGEIDVIWDSVTAVPPNPWPVWRSQHEWRGFVDGLHRAWGGRWEAPGRRFAEKPMPKAPDAPSAPVKAGSTALPTTPAPATVPKGDAR